VISQAGAMRNCRLRPDHRLLSRPQCPGPLGWFSCPPLRLLSNAIKARCSGSEFAIQAIFWTAKPRRRSSKPFPFEDSGVGKVSTVWRFSQASAAKTARAQPVLRYPVQRSRLQHPLLSPEFLNPLPIVRYLQRRVVCFPSTQSRFRSQETWKQRFLCFRTLGAAPKRSPAPVACPVLVL